MKAARYLATVVMMSGLAACSPQDPTRLKGGDELYDYYCRSCHQDTAVGAYLEQAVRAPEGLRPHEIVLMIRHGYRFDHPPVHLPQLTPEQADAIARYVQTLKQARAE